MSGFAGILHLDGAAASPEWIKSAAEAMAFRGPDGTQVRRSGPVALAHAAFYTTAEAPHWPQPLALGDRLVIAGDVRLDEIQELRARLAAAGEIPPPAADDALLILHAYRAWGRDCMRHLAGDFSFALWDAQARKLFCARDQIGVKPFFYARAGNAFLFSNTLACLLRHPAISEELDESAVADFLLFRGCQRNPEATIYRQVQRLAPAHCVEVSASVSVTRYWELPHEVLSERRRPSDCAEEFRTRLAASVRDRIRAPRIAVTLSGGMDSASVAALARHLLGPEFEMHAYTVGYRRVFDDPEPAWARRVADALGMEFHLHWADEYQLFAANNVPAAEPCFDPTRAMWYDFCRSMARTARVVLTGEGGDVMFLPPVVGEGLGWRHAGAIARHLRATRRLPRIGLRNSLGIGRAPDFAYPDCFQEDFERRHHLRERWHEAHREPQNRHRRRRLYDLLTGNFWPEFLSGLDAGVSGVPLRFGHPFFSRQMVEFMLTVPNHLLDLFDKRLLRESMAPLLPAAVRARRKTPLAADDVQLKLQRAEWHQAATQPAHPAMLAYVKPSAFAALPRGVSGDAVQQVLPAISLNCWLHARDAQHGSATVTKIVNSQM